MATVTFIPGIASISGKIGDTIYRTTPSGKTIAYKAPKRIYHQSTPAQLNHRTRFALMAKLVSTILHDPAQRAIYEQLQKQKPSTKHLTLRKFIFSILNS